MLRWLAYSRGTASMPPRMKLRVTRLAGRENGPSLISPYRRKCGGEDSTPARARLLRNILLPPHLRRTRTPVKTLLDSLVVGYMFGNSGAGVKPPIRRHRLGPLARRPPGAERRPLHIQITPTRRKARRSWTCPRRSIRTTRRPPRRASKVRGIDGRRSAHRRRGEGTAPPWRRWARRRPTSTPTGGCSPAPGRSGDHPRRHRPRRAASRQRRCSTRWPTWSSPSAGARRTQQAGARRQRVGARTSVPRRPSTSWPASPASIRN